MRGLAVDISPLRRSRDFRMLWLGELVSTMGRQITVVALNLPVGSNVDVKVVSPYGSSTLSAADKFTFTTNGLPAPVVSSISPTTGMHAVFLSFMSTSTGHFVNLNWFNFAH